MKIAFFTDTYRPQINGVVSSIVLFAEELRKKGHEVYIICPKDKKSLKEKDVHHIISLKFKPYPEYRIGIPSPKVMKIIKKIKPDIVHIHSPFTIGLAGLSVAKYKKIPVVMTYHTFITNYTHYLSRRKNMEKYNKKITKKYTKWFFNKADLIIAPSNPVKKILMNYGITKPIKVIPTGIKIRNNGTIHKNKKITLLHVGRVTREKEIEVVIREFKKISEKIDCELIIASDGPYRNYLENLVKKMGMKNVKFTGYLSEDELIKLYRRCHLFICASKSETQGMVVVESMACGCPVLVSNRMGFRDFVKDGENGFLFNKNQEISKKALEYLCNRKLIENITKNGYITAQNYTIKKTTKIMEKVYKSLIE